MVNFNSLKSLLFLLLFVTGNFVFSQTIDVSFNLEVSGFTRPVAIQFVDANRMFVVEQDGKIKIVTNGTINTTPFLDIDAKVNSSGNEQGLLGLAFAPDYTTSGRFYVNYTNNSGNTVIARYTVSANPDVADANSEEILLTIPQPFSNHNGGDLAFANDGFLYIGTGDEEVQEIPITMPKMEILF